jgi:hypothetical protein
MDDWLPGPPEWRLGQVKFAIGAGLEPHAAIAI